MSYAGITGRSHEVDKCGPSAENATETVTGVAGSVEQAGNHWVTCVEQLGAHGDCHNA